MGIGQEDFVECRSPRTHYLKPITWRSLFLNAYLLFFFCPARDPVLLGRGLDVFPEQGHHLGQLGKDHDAAAAGALDHLRLRHRHALPLRRQAQIGIGLRHRIAHLEIGVRQPPQQRPAGPGSLFFPQNSKLQIPIKFKVSMAETKKRPQMTNGRN